jgi:hypothetical protein
MANKKISDILEDWRAAQTEGFIPLRESALDILPIDTDEQVLAQFAPKPDVYFD